MALLLGVVNHFARSGSVIFSKDPDPDSRSMSRFEPSSLPSPRLPHISSLLLHTTYLLPHQCHAEAASEGPRISATIPECPISLYNESGQKCNFFGTVYLFSFFVLFAGACFSYIAPFKILYLVFSTYVLFFIWVFSIVDCSCETL